MDENSVIYKIGMGVLGIVTVFIVKPFWQMMKGGWEANSTNSSAQVQMISVLQAELDGYRQREAESRSLLTEVYQLRMELKDAREHIDAQSKLIEQLRKEIGELKSRGKV